MGTDTFDLGAIIPIILALSSFIIVAVVILGQNNPHKDIHDRTKRIMHAYLKDSKHPKITAEFNLRKVDKDSKLNTTIKRLPSIGKLRKRLDKTGRDISVGKYFRMVAISGLISYLVFIYIFKLPETLGILFALFFAIMIPHKLVTRWTNKRIKRFLTLLPDALDLIVRGLRSGLPITESINVIKNEIEEPIKGVFTEISQSTRVGVPFEQALLQASKKIGLNEFNFFVISVALQRETGGNLAEILENLSSTIRERTMMKLKVRAITSEARMSAYIIGALPFLIILVLTIMSPNYLDPMFDDVRGNIAGIAAMCSFSFGMFSMFRMAKFEI